MYSIYYVGVERLNYVLYCWQGIVVGWQVNQGLFEWVGLILVVVWGKVLGGWGDDLVVFEVFLFDIQLVIQVILCGFDQFDVFF